MIRHQTITNYFNPGTIFVLTHFTYKPRIITTSKKDVLLPIASVVNMVVGAGLKISRFSGHS